MCFTSRRVLIPAQIEAQKREIENRLNIRIEQSANRPPSDDDLIWEFVWMSQVAWMKHTAEKVYPLFSSLSPDDFSLYDDEMRFHFAHKQAAQDLAKYIVNPHEDCPMLWGKQQWIFFIRKLFHKALRQYPRPEFNFPSPPPSECSDCSSCCSQCLSDWFPFPSPHLYLMFV